MMITTKAANSAIVGIYRLLWFVFIIGCLYYGQSLLIPLTLAGLFTFLLSPLVTRLEMWLGRIMGISIVVFLFLLTIVSISYVLTNQIVEFTNNLPNYRINIENKLNILNISESNTINSILNKFEKVTTHPSDQTQYVTNKKDNLPLSTNILQSTSLDVLSIVKNFLTSLFDIVGSTALVILLVIFMLFYREDLRGRFIHLIGSRRIRATTAALDDASERVFDFLIAKLYINIFFGAIVSIGLYFLGIPNAILWGCLAGLLRFIPYIGSWIAAIIPIIVAFAISTNLIMILTIIFFGLLEIITGNFIEPFILSSRTGISSLSLIVSAVFWTYLWGPIGLLLSVPLTVCIVVVGRHISNLSFLSILLSDEKSLGLYEEYYQGLIALENSEIILSINNYLKNNSLVNLYDSIFIPILSAAETDRRQDYLDNEQLSFMYQNIEDILDDTGSSLVSEIPLKLPDYKVLCIPVEYESDKLTAIMLTQLLKEHAFETDVLLEKLNKEQMFSYLEKGNFDAICVSLHSAPLMKARTLITFLHHQFPQIKIILGLWSRTEINAETENKLKKIGVNSIVFTLSQAIEQFEKLHPAKS